MSSDTALMRHAFRIGSTKVNFGALTRYSPHTQEMFEGVVPGATDPDIEGVEVVRRPALTVAPAACLRPTATCWARR